MEATLPDFLNYKTGKDLIRIGRDFDGGYLISKNDLVNSDILISLGISDDWSFEEDFLELNNIDLIAFDGSISKSKFFNEVKHRLKSIYNLKSFIKAINTYKSYVSFFKKNKKHYVKNISNEILNGDKRNYISIGEIFKITTKENIFLKIDVEGWEYRYLETILENQKRLTGIVIEFHDVDLHLEKIKDFIDKIQLKLIHIHVNNHCEIIKSNRTPTIIEITLSRSSEILDNKIQPHFLDKPNNEKLEEVILSFKEYS